VHRLGRTDSWGHPIPATDEQVEAAENRWTCPGSTVVFYRDGKGILDMTCPGRDDVVADPATWTAWKRAMRVRRKTTVFKGENEPGDQFDLIGIIPRDLDAGIVRRIPSDLVPELSKGRTGTWTFEVTFEPDEV
jgi:hypothetical protein